MTGHASNQGLLSVLAICLILMQIAILASHGLQLSNPVPRSGGRLAGAAGRGSPAAGASALPSGRGSVAARHQLVKLVAVAACR